MSLALPLMLGPSPLSRYCIKKSVRLLSYVKTNLSCVDECHDSPHPGIASFSLHLLKVLRKLTKRGNAFHSVFSSDASVHTAQGLTLTTTTTTTIIGYSDNNRITVLFPKCNFRYTRKKNYPLTDFCQRARHAKGLLETAPFLLS